jgi:hypothetical protein
MPVHAPRDPYSLMDASKRRLQAAALRARNLGDYVLALLTHVNECAQALRSPQEQPRGRVVRVGLATVTEEGLVVPVPFRRAAPSLFLDQFHALPLRSTSLGPLLESGRGDGIEDLEAHLAARGSSLSTQIALREGLRSNVRLPWHSLDRRGILWFSADVPRFFSPALMEHLDSLVPEVELQLRLLDALSPLLPAGPARPRSLELHPEALLRLTELLDERVNPAPEALDLEWAEQPLHRGCGIAQVWRMAADQVLLAALEIESREEADLRLLLTVQGWVRQLALRHRHPGRLLEEVEKRLSQAWREESLAPSGRLSSLQLVVLHLRQGHLDHAGAGEKRLWIEDGGGHQALPTHPKAPGAGGDRLADSRSLPTGARLLLCRGPAAHPAKGWNLALGLKA